MELIKRFAMAIIFIPGILILFFRGGFPLASFLAMIVFLQMFELREIFIRKGFNIPRVTLPLSLVVFFASAMFGFLEILTSLFLVFLIVTGIDIIRNRIEGSFHRIAASIFFLIYTAVFMASVYRIRLLENGAYLIYSLIGLIWLTDTAAYFAGRYLGKHRGIFLASPNKSLEGYSAGVIMSIIAAFIFAHYGGFSLQQTISLAVAVGIFGQMGDLFESMLKRDVGVKDSSSFLPGHGGILDRFDSLTVAAPAFYILLSYWK